MNKDIENEILKQQIQELTSQLLKERKSRLTIYKVCSYHPDYDSASYWEFSTLEKATLFKEFLESEVNEKEISICPVKIDSYLKDKDFVKYRKKVNK